MRDFFISYARGNQPWASWVLKVEASAEASQAIGVVSPA